MTKSKKTYIYLNTVSQSKIFDSEEWEKMIFPHKTESIMGNRGRIPNKKTSNHYITLANNHNDSDFIDSGTLLADDSVADIKHAVPLHTANIQNASDMAKYHIWVTAVGGLHCCKFYNSGF